MASLLPPDALGQPASAPRKIGRLREFLYFAVRDKKIFVSLAIIATLLVVAFVGPMLRDYGPNEYVGPPAQAPSSEYWFGTTTFGQDVFVQFVHGVGATFFVGLLGGGLAALVGMTVGFVAGYRGGYLPNLRRQIEAGLRNHEVMGVVSTNALELGIDIGDLEACIMVGYPGSIASTWQQAGRVGRRAGQSFAILIARSSPMDQFIVEHPDYFFSRSPEHCRVNPDNLLILLHHLKSAAFELPFEKGEHFGKENLEELLDYLDGKGILHRVGDRWHWAAESYPADEISLRSVNPENVVVVDTTETGNHKVIAEVDWDSAFTTVHTDAIYMVESQQFHVSQLDLDGKKAYVRKVDVDYYTDAMTYTHVRVIDNFEKKRHRDAIVEHGEVQVVRKVTGYKKIKFYTLENLGFGDVFLPEKDMHTTSYWFTIPKDLLMRLPWTQAEIIDGLSGLAYSLHHLAAILLMADLHDVDRSIGDKSGEWFVRHGKSARTITASPAGTGAATGDPPSTMVDAFDPTVFIFDAYPGGIGFAELLYEEHQRLLSSARDLIGNCPCLHGCPTCVGPTLEVGQSAKAVARDIVDMIL